jgi:hypothetical protein
MKGCPMKKSIVNDSVYFEIEWSKPFLYDRITAGRVLPDMPGILFFSEQRGGDYLPLLLFAAWREGVRGGMRNLMDDMFSAMPHTSEELKKRNLYYRYAVVDTSAHDMKDILFWLVRTYEPEFNSIRGFSDSQRFVNIAVDEKPMR